MIFAQHLEPSSRKAVDPLQLSQISWDMPIPGWLRSSTRAQGMRVWWSNSAQLRNSINAFLSCRATICGRVCGKWEAQKPENSNKKPLLFQEAVCRVTSPAALVGSIGLEPTTSTMSTKVYRNKNIIMFAAFFLDLKGKTMSVLSLSWNGVISASSKATEILLYPNASHGKAALEQIVYCALNLLVFKAKPF